MKVEVTITVDTNTGDYDLVYKSEKKGQKIEQKLLAKIIRKVLDNWDMKFVD